MLGGSIINLGVKMSDSFRSSSHSGESLYSNWWTLFLRCLVKVTPWAQAGDGRLAYELRTTHLPGCPSPTDSDVNMKAPSSFREWSHKPSTGPFIVAHFPTSLFQGDNFEMLYLYLQSLFSFFLSLQNQQAGLWRSRGDDFCLSTYEQVRTG